MLIKFFAPPPSVSSRLHAKSYYTSHSISDLFQYYIRKDLCLITALTAEWIRRFSGQQDQATWSVGQYRIQNKANGGGGRWWQVRRRRRRPTRGPFRYRRPFPACCCSRAEPSLNSAPRPLSWGLRASTMMSQVHHGNFQLQCCRRLDGSFAGRGGRRCIYLNF